jgi:alanine dehydrogenase
MMLIGVLKEIKRQEFRVVITPAGVETLRTTYGPGPR